MNSARNAKLLRQQISLRPISKLPAGFVADALLLRTKHHIVGSFIGSLPRSPQQNIFFSLPLSLLPEELYVLIQEGRSRRRHQGANTINSTLLVSLFQELCTLQEDLGSHATPSANEIAAYEADAQEWAKSLQRTRAEAIVAQREAHLGSQRKDKGSAPTSAPDGSGTDQIRGTLATESDQAASALDVKSDPDSAHMRVWSHSSKLPWYRPQIQGRDFFPFPLSTEDKRRSQIFYDLWKKGMYLSSGSKFGANYLGYPG